MTSVSPIGPSGLVAENGDITATQFVNGATLDSNLQVLRTTIDALISALGVTIRADNLLVDSAVRLRSLDPEVTALLGSGSAGVVWQPKVAVALASTANLTLSGEQTIDGILTSASRILVKDQTVQSQNGIYVTGAGAWTRAADANTAALIGYAMCYVTGGTANATTVWINTIAASLITLGTTSLPFARLSANSGASISSAMIPVVGASTTALARAALGSTAVGDALFTAGTALVARQTIGVVAAMDAVIAAASTGAARTALGGVTPTVSTVAALRALATTDLAGDVFVEGYGASGDGGGGLFRWNAADGSTDNAGTIIQPNVGGVGRWNRSSGYHTVVDPRTFGAKGDGSNDDTTAIQNALNLGGAVFLPDGTYIFSALTIPSNVRLYGTGTLKLKATSGITVGEKYRLDATGSSNWSIEGITIDGNKSGQSGSAGFKVSGLLIRGGSDIRIQGVTFQNWHQDCIEATSATQNNPTGPDTPGAQPADTIRRVKILGCSFLTSGQNYDAGSGYSDSMSVQIGSSTEDFTVAHCNVYNCMAGFLAAAYNKRLRIANNTLYVDSATYTFRSSGIAVEQMSDTCAVIGNTIENFHEGVNAENPLRTSIVGNTILNCIRGINCFASSIGGVAINLREVVIANNTVKGATNESIRLVKSAGNGAFDCSITGNVCNGGSAGIVVSGITGIQVSGNECTGGGSGIQITSCVDGAVSANTCRANTTEGIYVATCTRCSVLANTSNGNSYGIYIDAMQTDLTVIGNNFLNNSTKDWFVATPSTNHIRSSANRLGTNTGALLTVSGDGASLQYVGDVENLAAATYTNFTGHTAGQVVRFIAAGSVTYTNNAAVTNKIFTKTGANVTDAANVGRSFVSDGTHLYEC